MSLKIQEILRNWLKANPFVFRWTENGNDFNLIENSSQKPYIIRTGTITAHRLTPHPQGENDYLNLAFDAGHEIVLCHAGIAFSPSFQNTGPLNDAPPVVCLMDYYQMYNHLIDLIKDESLKGQAIALFQVLIAVLDGARVVGLDVGPEEEQLDKLLTQFENGMVPGSSPG